MRDTWFLDQDVNAWTSLAYAAVGAVVVALVIRRRLRPVMVVLGRWPRPRVSAACCSRRPRRRRAVPPRRRPRRRPRLHRRLAGRAAHERTGAGTGALAGTVVTLAAGSVVWALAPSATNVMVGVLVAATVGAELVARRRGLPGVWNAPLVALAVGAGVVWWAGTPGSPLCDPGSWVQPHGGWHLLTALLVLGWIDQASYAADPCTPHDCSAADGSRDRAHRAGLARRSIAPSRSLAGTIAGRSTGADRGQPRQRLRRPDRHRRGVAPPAAVHRQGVAVEGGRGPPVARPRRCPPGAPGDRWRPHRRQPVGVRGVPPSSSPAARRSPSSPREPPATGQASIGSLRCGAHRPRRRRRRLPTW